MMQVAYAVWFKFTHSQLTACKMQQQDHVMDIRVTVDESL